MLSSEAQKLLERIRELESSSDGDPKAIQERMLLLEELARKIGREHA